MAPFPRAREQRVRDTETGGANAPPGTIPTRARAAGWEVLHLQHLCCGTIHTRDEARRWMILNQLSRRNLRPDAASYLRGCLVRMTPREKGGRPGENSSQNVTSLQAVADDAGVTRQTLHNDAAFADAVDTLAATVGEEARELATSGCIAAVLLLSRASRRPQERRRGTRWAVA